MSGLWPVAVIVEGCPAWTVDGFALHEMVGGCCGGACTVKLALQVAGAAFFAFGSVTVAFTVYCPGAKPAVSIATVLSFGVALPPLELNLYATV